MMYLFFSIFLSPDKTHTAKQQTDTDEKRKAQAKWCAQSVYRTMLCEQQSFQVKDPFVDTVLCFSLSIWLFRRILLWRWPSFSALCRRSATNGYWHTDILNGIHIAKHVKR